MSRLLEEERKRLQTEENFNTALCQKFTGLMRNIVENQEKHNDYFYGRLGIFAIYHNTDCDEFRNFVKEVNSDHSNKIHVDYRDNKINHVETIIDTENDLVTYKLRKYWNGKET